MRRSPQYTDGTLFSRSLSASQSLPRRSFLGLVGAAGGGAFAGCLGTSEWGDAESTAATTALLDEAALYKTPNCDCCYRYMNYLETKASVSIQAEEVSDLAEVKDEYNVPGDVQACHTMDVSDYYVEGHVPLPAINTLAEETPNIVGISLPGMPRGSPGMPGEKTEEFIVYAVHDDGSYDEFVRI